ncbi:2-C-methyl-D-erythritol 4-phosphate cytidylyltransferase [Azohydromonas caseinilytica]|uniref:2-C-methyl-D-erythritol 4-phosphate cytidylyltransferase n=1 Tax=Azohydromonas caseinilytica TaxID=2728836 RepID=A0A848F2R8_9BURK|nr:2-C-methyl-D-erythritol 4-phosphate cytidylyltransferase [Azohydromonas caseinilytica]NML14347.1 2-C-methyl-D-erythritol 4-phosphate cytidylyltransferase [Azohydromonas caseinilytica]
MTSLTHGPAPRCYALVPCAGTGSRSGADRPKQYVPLAGRALVAHTLDALARVPRLSATLVVLAPDDELFDAAVPQAAGDARVWTARRGGATRAATVAAGLEELLARGAAPDDWVLVHDAARCLIRPEWVLSLIEACEADEVGGLLALPVADTLKQEEQGRVAATIDRQAKWAAQTPQMFRIGLLRRALAATGEGVTDEASAVEALGLRPRLVPGALENFKLTWPADFGLAERLLQTMAPASDSSLARGAAVATAGGAR